MVVPTSDRVSFTPQQAEELEGLLERRWRGVDRAHRWSVLRYQAQFQGVGVSPKDAEFVQGLSLTARQVWNAFGIPAPLLNDLAHATLANTREFERLLWVHALKPDAMLRADEITEQFLPRIARRPGPPATPDCAEYDFGEVSALQFAETETWDRERQAIEVGAMTVNEWRRRHGLPDVKWGDVWWGPVNKSAVRDANSKPQGDTSPTGQPAGGGDQYQGDGQPAEGEPPEQEQLPEAAAFQPAGLLGALDDFRRLAARPLVTGRNGHHR
jgi:hypothetical protein